MLLEYKPASTFILLLAPIDVEQVQYYYGTFQILLQQNDNLIQ